MRVQLTAEARRQIVRLPRKVYEVVAATIDGPITENPYRASKALHHELALYRSVRRGDFRILLSVDEAEQLVTIVRIDHRSSVYRSR